MRVTAVRIACGVLATLVVGGCGRDVPTPDELDGADVSTMAEHELEAENPRIAPGTLSCPDLDFAVGSSVRCLRTVELGEGRVVKVGGTVSVTSLSSGGRLHVAMDEEPTEFGVAGDHLEADLRRQYLRRHLTPRGLECPYLRGEVGARVTCRLDAGGTRHDVDVVVTAVEADDYRTTYEVLAHHSGS